LAINCVNCGAPNDPGRTKCAYCGSQIQQAQPTPQQQPQAQQPIYGQPMYVQPVMMQATGAAGPQKSLVVAAVLAFFLGALGIHNFYLGYNGKGIAQLLLTIVGSAVGIGPLIAVIWALVEFIMILTRSYPDRWGRPLA
jgi:TM2 domain-containing membrane protein YozV